MNLTIRPPKFVREPEEIYYYAKVLKDLEDNNIAIQDQDAYGLGMLAINLALVDACVESINKKGMHISVQGDRNVIRKVNPAIALQKDAQTAIRHYLKEFQMSPNSRKEGSGFGSGKPKNKDAESDDFSQV